MSDHIAMVPVGRQVLVHEGGYAAAAAHGDAPRAVSASKVSLHLDQGLHLHQHGEIATPATDRDAGSLPPPPTWFQSLVFLLMELLLPPANFALHLSYMSAILDNTCVNRTLSEGKKDPTWTSNYYVLMLVVMTALSFLMLAVRTIFMYRMFRSSANRPAVLPMGIDKHHQGSTDASLSRWSRLYINWTTTSRRVEGCSIARVIVFFDTLLAESGLWFLSWYIPSEVHILSLLAIAKTFLGAISLAKVWGFESYLFLARGAACCITSARPNSKSKCTYAGIYISSIIALGAACAYPIVLYTGVVQTGIDGSYLNYQLRMQNVQCLMVDSLTNQTYWSKPVDTVSDTPDSTFIRATLIAWNQRSKYKDPVYHNAAYFVCPPQPQDPRNLTVNFDPYQSWYVSRLDLPFDILKSGFLVGYSGTVKRERWSNETGLSWDSDDVKYIQSKSADPSQLTLLPIVFNGNSTIRLALGHNSLSILSSMTLPPTNASPTRLIAFDLHLQTEWAKCSI